MNKNVKKRLLTFVGIATLTCILGIFATIYMNNDIKAVATSVNKYYYGSRDTTVSSYKNLGVSDAEFREKEVIPCITNGNHAYSIGKLKELVKMNLLTQQEYNNAIIDYVDSGVVQKGYQKYLYNQTIPGARSGGQLSPEEYNQFMTEYAVLTGTAVTTPQPVVEPTPVPTPAVTEQPEQSKETEKSEPVEPVVEEPVVEEKIEEVIDPCAEGHTLEEISRIEPTCAENGKIVSRCKVCGVEEETIIPKLGALKEDHAYELTETKEASCTESGYNRYACSVCRNTYDEEISATGHTPSEKKEVIKKAGFLTKGEEGIRCSICGEVLESVETMPLYLYVIIVAVPILLIVIGMIFKITQRRK